jgi:hypothetical protein
LKRGVVMENPSDVRRDKRFRWVGQVSEEELLGLPASGLHRTNGYYAVPRPAPARASEATGAERRRGPRARDLAAVVAVGGGVWLAVHLGESRLPSYGQSEVVPTASRADAGVVVVDSDRSELASLPRERPANSPARPRAGPTEAGGNTDGGRSKGNGSSGSSGAKDDDPAPPPPPTTETKEPPLLEANVPGVGSVTVEDPGLPDVDDVQTGTPTLPLA